MKTSKINIPANTNIKIFTYQFAHQPNRLPNTGYLITFTEATPDETKSYDITGYFTLNYRNLPAIFKEYFKAFKSFITEQLTEYQGFGDDEYDDYLPDYIEQLIQMAALLGKTHIPNRIISFLNNTGEQFDYDFSGLIECFDWDKIYSQELTMVLQLNDLAD